MAQNGGIVASLERGQPDDPRARVLVVEDDAANRMLLTHILEREGFRAVTAADGEACLHAVGEWQPDLILLDVGLPKLDGLAVCQRLRSVRETRTIPIILLTGRPDLADVVSGLDAGADDFVQKPFRTPELLARIRSAMRMRQAVVGMETARSVVAALANAVEAKDLSTELHCERLAGMTAQLGREVGLAPAELESLAYGSLLHDVGKIGIPEAILSKTGPLSEDEWTIMRRHPEIGERICRPLVLSGSFAPIIRHHHERWDGSGYPDGLVGDDIPLGARIVALADAFDAMTRDRPYRPAMRVEHAVDEIRRMAGRQFDPGLTPLFIPLAESYASSPAAAAPAPVGAMARRIPTQA
jgi:putative two-component system response regulator